MPAPNQPNMRRFGDHDATRTSIYDNAVGAISNLPPIENSRYKLTISDPGWSGPEKATIGMAKDALVYGRTLARRLTGNVSLINKADNSVVDARRMTVASIPILTQQGTFILEGTPTPLSHQQRLVPGVYHRQKQSGELEAHVNVLPGEGVSHRIILDPASGIFKTQVGQAEIPTAALLKIFGATDDDLKERWGETLALKNLKAIKPHHIDKYWEKFGSPGKAPDDKVKALVERMSKYPLDTWVMKRIFGKPYSNYGKDVLLDTTKKLLDISHGRAEQDDRDHPAYAAIYGPEHLLAERLRRSTPFLSKALWQATNVGHLNKLQPGFLNQAVRHVFTKSGLATAAEGVSALEYADHGSRLTKVGEGGIGKSAESVPMSARDVSSGQLGFVDLVRTSECFDEETEVLTKDGWKYWREVSGDDLFATMVNGKLEFNKAHKLHKYNYSGIMYGCNNKFINYLVTPNHRFFVYIEDDKELCCKLSEEIHGVEVCHVSDLNHNLENMIVSKVNNSDYYKIDNYKGNVYCATVPGSKLYVRRKDGHGFWSGNSESVGVDLRVAFGTRLGSDQRIYAPFYHVKSGKIVFRSPRDIADSVLAFPNTLESGDPVIPAIKKGKLTYVPRHEAEYQLPTMEQAFSPLSNLSPFKSAMKTHRAAMAGRMCQTGDTQVTIVREDNTIYRGNIENYKHETGDKICSINEHNKQIHLKPVISKTVLNNDKDIYRITLRNKQFITVTEDHHLVKMAWSGELQQIEAKNIKIKDSIPVIGGGEYKDNHECGDLLDIETFPIFEVLKEALPDDLKDKQLNRYELKKIFNLNEDNIITRWLKSDVVWLEVIAIEKLDKCKYPIVYDLDIGDSVYACNGGVFVHNCAQSLGLTNPEAPYVRTEVPGQPGKSYEELFGKHSGAVFAHNDKGPGRVVSITPDEIKVVYGDGTRENHELFNNVPTGRKTGTSSYPLVKPGDVVEPGQILARSNYTDNKGHAAYGLNARVGFIPFRGHVYEDSIVVSRSFGDKLKSEHIYHHQLTPDENTIIGVKAHTAAFGGKYPLAKLKNFDDSGVIKVGTRVEKDDPLILAVRRRPGEYAKLSRSGGTGLSDASEVWEHNEPGVVTDVVNAPQGPVVIVKSEKVLQQGDKLCYSEDTDVLTKAGWKSVKDINPLDEVATLNPNGELEYINPSVIHKYPHNDKLLEINNELCSLKVTLDHNLYVKRNDKYCLIVARELINSDFICKNIETEILVKINDQHLTEYDGDVYCVTLSKNHVLYVRRNGKPVWSGNSGRHGNKGVAVIVPDHEMPTDESGKPLDVAISSMSVIARTNPAQIFEAALGKIAAKTGKPYVVRDFAPGQNIGQEVENELAKHNVNFKETLTDPITGRQIPNVGVGNMYIMKLHHLSESKAKGRGLGGYDESGQPLRGASGKAMRMSLGDTNALLSAGATKVLHDSHMLRGQANDEFWAAFMAGFPTRPPHESAPFKRFLSELKGAGLNPIHKGTRYHLWAMTDKDVDALAGNRIVKNGETLDISRDGRPIKDGLHDPNIFGTVDSTTQWAKIPLHEPVINPAFEDPIRRLLGLTENKLREVIAGRQEISTGTGMKAIVDALRNYNVPKELEKARADFNSKRKTQRDDAQRKLGYLKHMSETNRSPADWILSSVPVLPPGFRPVSMGGRNNSTIVHDYNYVYKELIEANDVLKELSKQVSDTGDERLNLYDSIKAVTGLGDPVGAKNKERGVKGILSRLLGDTSKMSYLQQRLLGTPVNLSGRGAILPDPELDMDEIGVPKSIAWDIYHPFIVRRLVRSGMPRVEAVKQVTEQTDTAKDALKREMSERPVLANRYPLLHRYGHMAFNPVLVEGDAIRVNHIVTKGFNADFNGDSVLTDMVVVRINNELFIGNFEQFIQKYVLPDYVEKNAVDRFGKQTTGFEFDESVDIRVPSVNIDGSTSWNKVKQITIHTSHGPDCYMVKTKNGMQSIFTAHHNFLKLSPICEITSAYTSEVSVGDLVPTILGKDFDVINDKYEDTFNIDLNFDNGFWFGHYLAEGSITGRNDTVSQATTNNSLLQIIKDIGDKWIGKNSWVEGNGYSVRWTSAQLVQKIQEWCGRRSDDKHISGWMLNSPVEFRKGLIAGYVIGDGNKQTGLIRCETVSRKLALGMKMILGSLGVHSAITKGKSERIVNDTTHKKTYVLVINKKGFYKLNIKWPEFDSNQFKYEKLTKQTRNGYWDIVPLPQCIIDILSKRRKKFSNSKYAQQRYCPRSEALLIIKGMKKNELDELCVRNWIGIVSSTNLVWEPITSIEKVDRPDVTYDFSVEGSETFCIDGFYLTHNTFSLHVPLSDEAVKEAYEKMLPSRNLFSPASMKVHYLPNMEHVQALHAASTMDEQNPEVVFETKADMLKAYHEGKIGMGTRIKILKDK